MATGFLIGSAIFGLIGAQQTKKAQKRAGSAQFELDEENRRLAKLELDESIARTEDVNLQTEGIAAGKVGASGFGAGSSMDKYLETIKAVHAGDVDWMKTSGASRDAIAAREAAARKRNTDAFASAGFIKSIGGSLSSLGGYAWG